VAIAETTDEQFAGRRLEDWRVASGGELGDVGRHQSTVVGNCYQMTSFVGTAAVWWKGRLAVVEGTRAHNL